MIKLAYTALAAAVLLGAPAFAFDDSDRAAVKETFETLTDGLAKNDYEAVFSTTPPALIAKMAEPTGLDPDAFRTVMVTQMKAAMEQVKIEEVSYDLDGLTSGTSSEGRDYAVVMTETKMVMGENKMQAKAPALAFEDGDKWYVVQIQSPDQVALLASVYPDLAAIELPEPEVAAVE